MYSNRPPGRTTESNLLEVGVYKMANSRLRRVHTLLQRQRDISKKPIDVQ